MPSSSDSVAVLERGLSASWIRQVAASGGGGLHRYGGLLVALSGVADQTQQVAVVDGALDDPLASLVAAETAFRLAGWDPAVDLVAGAHPAIGALLAGRAYRIVVERPGMVREIASPSGPPRRLGVHVRAATAEDLPAVVRIQARAFGMDLGLADAMLPNRALADPGLTVLVASEADGGPPIGALSLHLDDDIVGIIGAAVAPDLQGRGVGRALADAALDHAAARGASHAWLQSTPAGEALWRGCGFVEVGSCQVWLSSHHPDPELHESWIPTGL